LPEEWKDVLNSIIGRGQNKAYEAYAVTRRLISYDKAYEMYDEGIANVLDSGFSVIFP
jgi:hypothetical protein